MAGTTIITGGAGFIGSHLADALKSRGRRLVLIDDLSTGSEANVAHLLDDDCMLVCGKVRETLRDRSALLDGVEQVYHLAASVGVQLVVDDPAAIIRNNVEQTAALLDAAGRAGANVLLTSTSEVYGKSEQLPLREDGDLLYGPTTGPRWSYALSKALDEQLVLAHHAQQRGGAVVVRLFNTIGPRQVGRYGMVVPRFVQAVVAGEDLRVYGDGSQTRCFCDVRDVVEAMIRLLEQPVHHGRVFNIGSDDEVTIDALADRVIALAGSRSKKRYVPFDQAYGPGFEDPFRRRVPDLSRIRAAIGFEPRFRLDQTLKQLIETAQTAATADKT